MDIYVYLCTRIPNNRFFSKKFCYWGIAAIISMTSATYIGLTYLIRNINPNLTTTQLLQESWDKFGLKFLKIYPYNLYINANQLWQDQRAWNRAQEELNNFSFGIHNHDSIENTLYILYIGEAARYDHWGINAYQRNTTPRLSQQENIILCVSLPHWLSRKLASNWNGKAKVLMSFVSLSADTWKENKCYGRNQLFHT